MKVFTVYPFLKRGTANLSIFFPETMDAGPDDDFLHFAEQFMGIVYPADVFDDRYKITGQDGVEVNGAYQCGFFEQQVKKEPEVEFGIKHESLIKNAPYPELMKRHGYEGNGTW